MINMIFEDVEIPNVVSDEVIYQVQSGCGVFVREVLWVAEADRWMCDQLNMSDFCLFITRADFACTG